MLRRVVGALTTLLLVAGALMSSVPSAAGECGASAKSNTQYGDDSVSVGCTELVPGTAGDSGSSDSGCVDASGNPVDCYRGEAWWSPTYQAYCEVAVGAPGQALTAPMAVEPDPDAILYLCTSLTGWVTPVWETPSTPGTSAETIVRSAVTTLGLHAPVVGVGAFVYPGYEPWGLSWWVGAPLWLWVDTSDDLQWGSHTISASLDGVSITADVTASTVTFTMGDDSDPVSCKGPGTPRYWDPNDLLSNHSPSGCEYTYTTTNTLGDKRSRFEVSSSVTWVVTWSASTGEQGSFTTVVESTSPASIHVGQIKVVAVPVPPGH